MKRSSSANAPLLALLVWQDHLLEKIEGIETDYVSPGCSHTPCAPMISGGVLQYGWLIFKVGVRLLFSQYDLVILPAVHFAWHNDGSRYRGKGLFRRLIRYCVTQTKLFPWFFRRVAKKGVIAILDRCDEPKVADDYARAVNAELYFKGNVMPGRLKSQSFQVRYLPYWCFFENYPETSEEKTIDLFYCAGPHSGARMLVPEELERLRAAGVTVFAPQERFSFEEFVSYLGKSRFTLSPEGHGYHCFRHYEAMAMKSVPVVNKVPEGMLSWLVPGENCLFYDPNVPGDLARCVLEGLKEGEMQRKGTELRDFALEHHSVEGVGRYIVKEMLPLLQRSKTVRGSAALSAERVG